MADHQREAACANKAIRTVACICTYDAGAGPGVRCGLAALDPLTRPALDRSEPALVEASET